MKILLIILFIYLTIILYYDIKALVEMFKYAYKEGRRRKFPIFVVMAACLCSGVFLKVLFFALINIFSIAFILFMLFK